MCYKIKETGKEYKTLAGAMSGRDAYFRKLGISQTWTVGSSVSVGKDSLIYKIKASNGYAVCTVESVE